MVESAERILVYKFPQFSWKELEQMFNLVDMKETAFYREAFSEGKAEGRNEGKNEGKKEGEKEGEKKAVWMPAAAAGVGLERGADCRRADLDIDEVRQVAALSPPVKSASSRRRVSRSTKNGVPEA